MVTTTDSGNVNPAFIGSNLNLGASTLVADTVKNGRKTETTSADVEKQTTENWGHQIEFLMSCIALSVGLGNVWRFPFTALDNGGGAFLIPYIIVLFLVGRPVYYLEMLMGQFSGRGSVSTYDFSPIMRGIAYGQSFSTAIVSTYYASLMAVTIHYLVDSFFPVLPWSYCRTEFGPNCVDSQTNVFNNISNLTPQKTSAEFYYINIILQEKTSIDDGLGAPIWKLAIGLFVSWIIIGMCTFKGIESSGKAAYFLALFPYCVMILLLIRSITLPGAVDGILYFLTPQWDKIIDPQVWYAAITQVFFSLSVCFGCITMYSSFNKFKHNIHRDVVIITTLDTCTSLLSGIIIFGILGNLAHETGTKDIQNVIKGGNGLAFISYPDAISKFSFAPQFFAVLFFVMLFVLGIGSNVGMATCVIHVTKQHFPHTKYWIVVLGVAVVNYAIGLIYVTPGGQFILNFLDFYGVTLVALTLAIFELMAISWIYGVKRFCFDIHFMMGRKVSWYYRICWGVITPALMTIILIYTLATYTPIKYNDYEFSHGMYIFGWCIYAFAVGQIIVWAIYEVNKQSGANYFERFKNSFKTTQNWGPQDPIYFKEYQLHLQIHNADAELMKDKGIWSRLIDNIFG